MQLQETYTVTGPQLDVLGRAEQSLPPPLKKRSSAAVIAVVLALVAVIGLGGFKLRGRYNAVQSAYTVSDEYGYSLTNDLALRADAAANIIRIGEQVLGQDDALVTAAQQALDEFNATDASHPAAQYAANTALGAAIDALYQQTAQQAGDRAQTLQTQWSEFLSRQSIILREAANGYNAQAEEYNQQAGSFPANVIGAVWGCGKAELFQ